jgi:hypothetical protein
VISRLAGSGESALRRVAGRVFSRHFLRLFLVFFLAAGIAAEAYYLFVLRDKIAGQSEELGKMSVQLQTLKNERNSLGEELSSIKKLAGDNKNGNTSDGHD